MKNFWSVYVMIFLLIVLWSEDAHAYLDPGTGSMILQMAIAGIVSTLFILKMFWRRIVDYIASLSKKKK